MYKICEQRGSGLIRAGLQVEVFGLPPIKFEEQSNHFKVTLFAPKTFAQMSASDRLNACYQHTLLKYVSSSVMTNKSLRERLKMPEKQRSMVSRLIQEATDKNLIAPADPANSSKKYTEYIPAWAAPTTKS
jgi:ATP-dependent DNA helicase RecG